VATTAVESDQIVLSYFSGTPSCCIKRLCAKIYFAGERLENQQLETGYVNRFIFVASSVSLRV
jgi:hypothetical protein